MRKVKNVMVDRSHQIAVNLQPSAIVKLERLRYLSNLWDNALRIPGTKLRVGLESIVGLLPFGGDIIGLILAVNNNMLSPTHYSNNTKNLRTCH